MANKSDFYIYFFLSELVALELVATGKQNLKGKGGQTIISSSFFNVDLGGEFQITTL